MRSSTLMTSARAGPRTRVSSASRTSFCWIDSSLRRAASNAASFDQVAQVRSHQTGRGGGDLLQVDVGRQRHAARVDPQDHLATDLVRWLHRHPTIESSRSQQRLVEHVRAVGRRQHDDALARAEAVHLSQDLIQRLLLLGVAAGKDARAARSSDRIQLVDENDGWRRVAGLFEQIAHAAGAHADDHLHELAGAHAEKRHVGFAGHRPGQQGLSRAWRADEQHPFGHHATQPRVLRRVLEKIDDLDELSLGFFDTRHVGEGDAAIADGRLVVALGLALAQTEDATTTHLSGGFPGQPQEPTDQQQRGAKAKENGDERIARVDPAAVR